MNATSSRRTRRLAPLLVALPLLAACGGGHDGDFRTRPEPDAAPALSRDTHLVITTENGVRLRPGDGEHPVTDPQVRARWSHRDDTWVLDLTCPGHDGDGRDGDGQDGDGRDGDGRDGACPRMPAIDVPAVASVTVTARNAGIDVAGVAAPLDLTTVNGDVTVVRSGRDDATVRLTTRNGSVRAGTLRSGRLHAETVNGDVTLGSTTSPAPLSAATTNGSLRVSLPQSGPAYRVAATARNGTTSVTVPTTAERTGPSLTLRTVNGDATATRD
ncbi:DUF4097 family beta strand repeat-containing protein [Streptomyces sp. AM 2-1-1]|uniref:DUF4097 family beta strand repeat-containing protein n=1 Tax=Streptomyces sp. AM 2-1-1 TaxID=3028709 RepID=UPI0023B9772D|nr:DUF4097 family beta strand repeat-containing protein [Streptomyces sp. AM 2-1-1]WEH41606.1 DUF4097 family beta strand repeat-containing protein [Streptomyces sp. AM 2-1-1]